MSVKSFKFVSPGVFINEIDNSFRPRRPDAIGPVVIGRSVRGLAMQPVKLESYSDFVTMYGDTVPGNAGGDVYRDGNYQSPMYATYAAKAFLNASVAPVTFVRLLGTENDNKITGGEAGWKTTKTVAQADTATQNENGGAFGLWVFPEAGLVKAAGSVTFSASGSPAATTNGTVEIISADGTTIVYTAKTSEDLAANEFKGNGTKVEAAASLKSCIEHASGHNGKITVSDDGAGVLTLTQAAAGTEGNQAITLASIGGDVSRTSFTGGASDIGAGTLAAVWYVDQSASIQLEGTLAGAGTYTDAAGALILPTAQGVGEVIESDSAGAFTLLVGGSKASSGADEKFSFNFDDTSEKFIRKVFNTNPQLVQGGDFYDSTLERNYWLGGSFEQEVRDGGRGSLTGSATSLVTSKMYGVILPIEKSGEGPSKMQTSTQEAQTGWFIGQDLGAPAGFVAEESQKLFKLKGRGHGEWLHKNVKVSIENIRYSTTRTTDFGTFSIVLRSLTDTDSNPVVLERFDNLSLDPRSPNYVSRRIGDRYYEWNESERRLREYGEYPNQSKFVYVSDINEGNIQNANSLIPFGYYGPPNFSGVTNWSGSASDTTSDIATKYIHTGTTFATGSDGSFLSGATQQLTASLEWPKVRLRHSSSDGGLSDQTNAYFGMQTTRDVTATRGDMSVKDYHRLWLQSGWGGDGAGLVEQSYIFTMDDIIANASSLVASYESGSRRGQYSYTAQTGKTYKDLIDLGYDQFTAPFWGGFDGFDITKPDPVANVNMQGTVTDKSNYVFNTYKRAIDTVADPEFVDLNLMVAPGLTKEGLTTHMIDVCENRADAMALIDLPDVYLPAHEGDYQNKTTLASRQASSPSQAATALRTRQIDSSYGATFYPWVQTLDEPTGQLLWIPPTVAMMGVLASSERSSQVWFAPAGFNRGGLSDGAAGIPISSVSRRLTSKERDVLYESRINPIASFPSSGIVVFGQKTLQERPSALDRINVRRLVIFLKKQISILSTQILFEQNVQATWNRFKSLIEPFLANVKTQFGISDYRLILDENTTTPDLIDQNILYAKIMVKPARAIEYIAIDFIVASTGASFDD